MAKPRGHINPEALERSLSALRSAVRTSELEESLGEVLDAACIVFAVNGTGLMVIDGDRALCAVAASDHTGLLFEETQERLGHGPCVDALTFDRVVQSRDLVGDDRWEELHELAEEHGIRAVLGVPVHISGEAVGSLNGYADESHEWTEEEVRALLAYAGLIGNLLASAVREEQHGELAEQLQHALDARVVIERAVGMMMGRRSVDAVTAYNQLRRAARNRGQRVAEVSQRLLSGERLEDL